MRAVQSDRVEVRRALLNTEIRLCQDVRIAEDRRHRGTDLVAHIGQELTLGARGREGALPRTDQFLLSPLALGDVANGGRDDLAVLGLDWAQADLDGELGPVLPPPVELEPGSHGPELRLALVRRPMPYVLPPNPLRHELLDGLANELFARIAKEGLRLRIHHRQLAPLVDDHHGVRRRLQEIHEPHLGSLALGDVAADGRCAEDLPARIADRGNGQGDLHEP